MSSNKLNYLFIVLLMVFTLCSDTIFSKNLLKQSQNKILAPLQEDDTCNDIGPTDCTNQQYWDEVNRSCKNRCKAPLLWNLKNEQCELPCDFGFKYNPTIIECVPICEPGFKYVVDKCVQICEEGEYFDIKEKKCKPDCKSGTMYLAGLKRCITPNVCPPCQVFGNRSGTCIDMCCRGKGYKFDKTTFGCALICPTEQYWNGKDCQATKPDVPECEQGQAFNFDSRKCEEICNSRLGLKYNSKFSGLCISTCGRLEAWDVDSGKCVSAEPRCTNGRFFNPYSNSCINTCRYPYILDNLKVCYQRCESGFSFSLDKNECVPAMLDDPIPVASPICKEGYKLIMKRCIKITDCENGLVFNLITNKCEEP